jgi:CBS domain-containing protein
VGWLRSLFTDPGAMAERYARTHGGTAEEIMTEDVVSVTEADSAAHVAHLMEDRGIRRVLVLEKGRLRGIVSRADLLRALVAPPATTGGDLSDERIRAAVMAAMRREPWADTFYTLVEVKDGVVEFHGFMRTEQVKRGLRVLAEQVPGVKGVLDSTQPIPTYLDGGV